MLLFIALMCTPCTVHCAHVQCLSVKLHSTLFCKVTTVSQSNVGQLGMYNIAGRVLFLSQFQSIAVWSKTRVQNIIVAMWKSSRGDAMCVNVCYWVVIAD